MDRKYFAAVCFICMFASSSGRRPYNPRDYYNELDGRLEEGYPMYAPNLELELDMRGYVSDHPNDWGSMFLNQALITPKCTDIPSNLSLCQNLDYSRMRLPNLLDHDTIDEVIQQSTPWNILLSINCHPDAKIFLCSLFAPVCLETFLPLIKPCRSLCVGVKNGCEGRMLKRGFPWPEMLDCDQFPLSNNLCVPPQAHTSPSHKNICKPCGHPDTFVALMDNYCSAASVVRVNIKKTRRKKDGSLLVVTGRKKKLYKKEEGLLKLKRKSMPIKIEHAEKCECELDNTKKYLAMGKLQDGVLVAHALHVYNRRNSELKKAMRTMKKDKTFCQKKGMEILTLEDEVKPVGKSRKRMRRERKKKKAKTDGGG